MDVSLQQAPPAAPPALSGWRQAMLSLYWFATSTHWSAILLFILPYQARLIGGDEAKGTTLGSILLVGAFVSMLVAPLFGAWSDRVRTRWGRRKPFLLVGTLGNIIGLVLLALLPATPSALVLYIALFMVIQLFNNLATAPYSALIPDVVPAHQRGSASGWMGLMTMLGNLAGAVIGITMTALGGPFGAYLVLCGILLVGMLGSLLFIREPAARPVAPFQFGVFVRGLAAPFRAPDFRWVFFTRFLVMMGIFTVQENLQFYVHDVIAGGVDTFVYMAFGMKLAGEAHAATGFFMMTLLLGAVLSSLFSGKLSDRYGRKRIVYLSGAIQGLLALVFIITNQFQMVLIIGVLFGLGYGAYQAVDWALATDVLPSEEDHAKDMGVWHIAVTLPQVTAAPIAGILLDQFSRIGRESNVPILGYLVIFALAFVYFVFGTVLVSKVRGAR